MNAAARADVYRRQTGRAQLTPAQARRDRHKTNRAKRQQQAATATSMRAAVDGLPALASSPGEVGSPASPAVQHPATANRPAPLRPGT